MSKQDKLTKAVESQAANLDPAQREFVMAELETYLWNKGKIESIQNDVDSGMLDPDAEKKQLSERHQLVSESSALFSHIMRWLKNTAAQESELDTFLNG